MIDIVNNAIQTVAVGGGVVFGAPRISTGCCSARHENGSSRFVLLKPGVYSVLFFGNIAVPDGGTVGEIGVALSVDGEIVTGSEAVYTPAAVDVYGNVTTAALIRVYGCGGNVSVSVVNAADIPINVQNANLIIKRECGGDMV